MVVVQIAKRTLGMALLGALLVFAFAPFYRAMLALLIPALLLIACQDLKPGQAFRRAWWFGLGYFLAAVYWIYFSMHIYYRIPVIITLAIVTGLASYLALFPALILYLAKKLSKDQHTFSTLTAVLMIPALWALFEVLRGWLFSGFPWLAIGYSQTGTILNGFAPLLGVYGISWVVLVLSGLIYLVLAPLRARNSRIFYAVLSAYILFALLGWNWLCWIILVAGFGWACYQKQLIVVTGLLIVVVGFGVSNIQFSEKSGAPLNIAVVQGNVHQAVKWEVPAGLTLSVRKYLRLSKPLWKSDLVIWPETALPENLGELRQGVIKPIQRDILSVYNSTLLMGIPVGTTLQRGKKTISASYNSVIKLSRNDLQRYDKKHLVPFGEFMPFQELFSGFYKAIGMDIVPFISGALDQRPIEIKGHVIGIYICYEIVFGHEVAKAFPEAAFLINFSNNAWFYNPKIVNNNGAVSAEKQINKVMPWNDRTGLRNLFSPWVGDSLEAYQHLQIVQMRALETARYAISATNDGLTVLISPQGKIVKALPRFQEGVLALELQPLRGATLYALIGDYWVLILVLIVVLLVKIKSKNKDCNKIQA